VRPTNRLKAFRVFGVENIQVFGAGFEEADRLPVDPVAIRMEARGVAVFRGRVRHNGAIASMTRPARFAVRDTSLTIS
jgi:hypothetical protein